MEKKSYKEKKDNRAIIDLEKYPQFGTICSQVNDTKYFVPLSPNDKQKAEIKSSYICIDSNYQKKETFYIYMNAQDEQVAGKTI
jgi:hypothetical protein